MSDFPDQTRMWDAYGHAMRAAAGLELTMRIALWDATRTHFADNPEMREKTAERIRKLTFGGTAKKFKAVYPGFAENPTFVAGMEAAIGFRNHLAHHFLESAMEGIRTQEGVELLEMECRLASGHFQDLEAFIRTLCPADIAGFIQLGQPKAEEWVKNHPLRDKLSELKAGKLATGDALRWWQRRLMKKDSNP